MVFIGVSPRVIGLFYLTTLGLALGSQTCNPDENPPCRQSEWGIGEAHSSGQTGRKLLQESRDAVAPRQSLVPVLTNRRSLLEAMCSETDNSVDAVIHCTNAVRSSPSSFVFPCGKLNMNGGLGPLSKKEELMNAAEAHSKDNAKMGDLTHRGSDGSQASTRVRRAGYAHGMVRENIAYGYLSARSVVFGWMCSSGHRKNIMNCDTADIGVGLAQGYNGRYYHTQVFACPQGQRCTCSGGGGGDQPSSEEEEEEKPTSSPVEGGSDGDGHHEVPHEQTPYQEPSKKHPYYEGYYDYHPYYGHGDGASHSKKEEEDEDEEGTSTPTYTDPYMMYGDGHGQGRHEGPGGHPHGMTVGKSKDGKKIYVIGDGSFAPHGGFHVSMTTKPSHGEYPHGGYAGN